MELNVAQWQRHVEDDGSAVETGPACYMFEAATTVVSSLINVLVLEPEHIEREHFEALRDEFRKFYMWNEGLATRSGQLDQILSSSRSLKATVLKLIAHWITTILKVPEVLSAYDWSSLRSSFAELEVIAYKGNQTAEAAKADMKPCYLLNETSNSGNDSDSDSNSSALSDEELDFYELIEDLYTYMESLQDLTPSLEYPAVDTQQIGTTATLTDDLSSVSELARPFVVIIMDRFPSIDFPLARKLGESNWIRRERLREKLASQSVNNEQVSSNDDVGQETIVDGNVIAFENQVMRDAAPPAPSQYTRSITSRYQSITTTSGFSEPSLFDSVPARGPVTSAHRHVAESVTSFATSMAGAFHNGQRRVPSLPTGHDFTAPFRCQFCGKSLESIQNRADWENHVYNDLEPYVCLFPDCEKGIETIRSRAEWVNHEFRSHRIVPQWHCGLCKEMFDSQESFRVHVDSVHKEDFSVVQVEELITCSKRIVAREASQEICPFCLTKPAQTLGGFARHVGNHQQEISLAALPKLETGGENSDSDSGSDHDGKDSENGSKLSEKSDETQKGQFVKASGLDAKALEDHGTSEKKRVSEDGVEGQTSQNHPTLGDAVNKSDGNLRVLNSDYSFEALQDFVISNATDHFKLMLEKCPNINEIEDAHGTILQTASYEGNASIVRLLLARGADPMLQSELYGNALQAAAAGALKCDERERHVEVMDILLQAGADIVIDGVNYSHSLYAAVRNGDVLTADSWLHHRKTNPMLPLKEKNASVDRQRQLNSRLEDTITAMKVSVASKNAIEPAKAKEGIARLCEGCRGVLKEGKAFELAGMRWHFDCFRCKVCSTLLRSDSGILLLGGGSLICVNCAYACSICGEKIKHLAILGGGQAFCTTCFRCRNCKGHIENLRYARTSKGIFCKPCYESIMRKRKIKKMSEEEAKNALAESGPATSNKAVSSTVNGAKKNSSDSRLLRSISTLFTTK